MSTATLQLCLGESGFVPQRPVISLFVTDETFVNEVTTSKLITFSLVLISHIIATSCLEFLTWESVLPARGDVREVMCLESW